MKTVKDISLRVFIECAVDGNLSGLGAATQDEAEALWNTINADFAAIRGDETIHATLHIVCEMEAIKYRAQLIDLLIQCLYTGYHKEVAEILRTEYRRQKLQFTEQSYIQDIESIGKIENNSIIKLTQLKAEYDRLSADSDKSPKGGKLTRLDYIQYMLDINKHEGATYTEDTMTVEIFALCLRRLSDHYNHIKEMQNGAGR